MRAAYLDTSALIAVAFEEPGAAHVQNFLEEEPRLVSSELIVAETFSAFVRNDRPLTEARTWLESVNRIPVEGPLDKELTRIFRSSRVRGADAFHLATALWLTGGASLVFLTLNKQQALAARQLGFEVPLPIDDFDG